MIAADWRHRVAELAKLTAERDAIKTLTADIALVHNRLVTDMAALSDRVASQEMRGNKTPLRQTAPL